MDPDGDTLRQSDAALLTALAEAASSGPGRLTRQQLLRRTGVPDVLLDAIERQGFLQPVHTDGERLYTADQVAAVKAGMALLDAGLPAGELLDLARHLDERLGEVADHAVDVFVRFVRDPVQGTTRSDREAAERLVAAFREMLPATGTLVSHRFRQLVIACARARVEAVSET